METKTHQLIPLMIINDNSRYITHERDRKEWIAAANEMGECLKNAMADCYTNNTMTAEAYISNIQNYFSQAEHKLTFEPNMEVTLVDQYGRPWQESEGLNEEAATTGYVNSKIDGLRAISSTVQSETEKKLLLQSAWNTVLNIVGGVDDSVTKLGNVSLTAAETTAIPEEQLSEEERQKKYAEIVEYGKTVEKLDDFKSYVEEHGSWLTQEEKEALYGWWDELHPTTKWWEYLLGLFPLFLTGCSNEKPSAPELKPLPTETETEGSTKGEGKVTSQMMKDFGWSVSDDELTKINNMLVKYGITNMDSIRLFMATCAH